MSDFYRQAQNKEQEPGRRIIADVGHGAHGEKREPQRHGEHGEHGDLLRSYLHTVCAFFNQLVLLQKFDNQ